MNETILITGGQGFLGRAVVQEWLHNSDGFIVAIGRSERNDTHYSHVATWNGKQYKAPLPASMANLSKSSRYQYIVQDINDQAGLCLLLKRICPTVIIHLAGVLRDSPVAKLCSGNIAGTASLLQAIVGANITPKAIIMGSSGGVYGVPKLLPISENTPCQPIDPYSASKLASENFARIIGKRHSLPLRWARIFNCIGAGQDERHLTSWIALQLAEIHRNINPPSISIGDLSTTRDYIHAKDVARAMRLIAEHGEDHQIYNVASGIETSGEEILESGLNIIERKTIEREIRNMRPSDIPRHFADITKLKALGFEPRMGIRESMQEMILWYEQEVPQSAKTALDINLNHFSVSVDHHHSYDVCVEDNLLQTLPQRLRQINSTMQLHLITDEQVWELYADYVFHALKESGFCIHHSILPAGERTKSLPFHRQLIEDLNNSGFQRRSNILAFGGGVILDLAGFVASTYMRGVGYINIPTTLLAQHDAAIGGKTATNMPWSKNFVGSFHHPQAVFIDPTVLKTLSDRDISSGVAEAIKVSMCGCRTLFNLLEENVQEIRYQRSSAHLSRLVTLAAHRKSEILKEDPYEVDLRRILNLGHTIGHPLETLLMYKGLRHGEAVGFGIAASLSIALNRKICSRRDGDRIYSLLEAYGLPPKVDKSLLNSIYDHLDSVRRIRGGNLNFVLPTRIDHVVVVQDVTSDEIHQALKDVCNRYSFVSI